MAKVFGIHYITLRNTATMEDFEAFLKRAAPTVKPWPGVKLYVAKGDRGDRVGRLICIIEFESVGTRNRYFPDPRGMNASVEGKERLAEMADFIAEWEQYATFLGDPILWTDYVVFGQF